MLPDLVRPPQLVVLNLAQVLVLKVQMRQLPEEQKQQIQSLQVLPPAAVVKVTQ
jgi:hypothetical protein